MSFKYYLFTFLSCRDPECQVKYCGKDHEYQNKRIYLFAQFKCNCRTLKDEHDQRIDDRKVCNAVIKEFKKHESEYGYKNKCRCKFGDIKRYRQRTEFKSYITNRNRHGKEC